MRGTSIPSVAMSTFQEPSTSTSRVSWPERYEQVVVANKRLKLRLQELQKAHRRALTVIPHDATQPTNAVYVKQVIEENRELLARTRSLELRLAKRAPAQEVPPLIPPRKTKVSARRVSKAASRPRAENDESSSPVVQDIQTEPMAQATQVPEPTEAIMQQQSLRPLLADMRQRLSELELDLERLRQENELLRLENQSNAENAREHGNPVPVQDDAFSKPRGGTVAKVVAAQARQLQHDQTRELEHLLSDRVRQLQVLEARFQHLQQSSQAQHELHKQSVSQIDELTGKLFEAEQKILDQAQRLQAHKENTTVVDALRKDLHLVRSENSALNDAIATLSARPFETLHTALDKKNLVIAQLEAEQLKLETQAKQSRQDYRVVMVTNDKLRARVNDMSTQLEQQAHDLDSAKGELERLTMERDVAELKLRFHLGADEGSQELMDAVGRALKMMHADAKAKDSDVENTDTTNPPLVLATPTPSRCKLCQSVMVDDPRDIHPLQKQRLDKVAELTKLMAEDKAAQLLSLRITHEAEVRHLKREMRQWEQRATSYLAQISTLQRERGEQLARERVASVSCPEVPPVQIQQDSEASLLFRRVGEPPCPSMVERHSVFTSNDTNKSESALVLESENVMELTFTNLRVDATFSSLDHGTCQWMTGYANTTAPGSRPHIILMCDYFDFESQASPVYTLEDTTEPLTIAIDFSITYKLAINENFARSPIASQFTVELHHLCTGTMGILGIAHVSLTPLFMSSTGATTLSVKLLSPDSLTPIGSIKLSQALHHPVDHLFRLWLRNARPPRAPVSMQLSSSQRYGAAKGHTHLLSIRIISMLLFQSFVAQLNAQAQTTEEFPSFMLSYKFMGYPSVYYRVPIKNGCDGMDPVAHNGELANSCRLVVLDRSHGFQVPVDAHFDEFLARYTLPLRIGMASPSQLNQQDSTEVGGSAELRFQDVLRSTPTNALTSKLLSIAITDNSHDAGVLGQVFVEVVLNRDHCPRSKPVDAVNTLTLTKSIVKQVLGSLHPEDGIDWSKFCIVMQLTPLERLIRHVICNNLTSSSACSVTRARLLRELRKHTSDLQVNVMAPMTTVTGMQQFLKSVGLDLSRADFMIVYHGLIHIYRETHKESKSTERKNLQDTLNTRTELPHKRDARSHQHSEILSELQLLCESALPDWVSIEPQVRQQVYKLNLVGKRAATKMSSAADNMEQTEVIDWETFRRRLRLVVDESSTEEVA